MGILIEAEPTIPVFGPGSLGVAHKPNECLPAEDFLRSVDLLDSFVRHYLRGEM
jgi:acetylornithine deacetylase/succinyl-diaminopimelate desuccinylase-like protein